MPSNETDVERLARLLRQCTERSDLEMSVTVLPKGARIELARRQGGPTRTFEGEAGALADALELAILREFLRRQ